MLLVRRHLVHGQQFFDSGEMYRVSHKSSQIGRSKSNSNLLAVQIQAFKMKIDGFALLLIHCTISGTLPSR